MNIDATVADNVDKAVEDYAGGAAELCMLESDQVRGLNEQLAEANLLLDNVGNCFSIDDGAWWDCIGEINIDAPPTREFDSWDTRAKCENSGRCYNGP